MYTKYTPHTHIYSYIHIFYVCEPQKLFGAKPRSPVPSRSSRIFLGPNLLLQCRTCFFMATVVTQLYLPSGDLLIALENSPFIDSLSWFSYKLLIFHSYVTLW